MSRWGFLVVLAVVASGCTRVIDNPQAKPEPAVAPITALQFSDLLSPHVHGGEGNLFVSVDPDRCGGVAREVNPPFIASHGPIATDGGHWEAESENAYIEELVAVYRSDFDSGNALATARQTIESCRGTPIAVTTMQGRTYTFNLRPRRTRARKTVCSGRCGRATGVVTTPSSRRTTQRSSSRRADLLEGLT